MDPAGKHDGAMCDRAGGTREFTGGFAGGAGADDEEGVQV
jgi:hypothetical protein